MKKLISCLLAVALVFSLMGVSVFAAGTSVHVVGNNPDLGTIDDGVDFGSATGSNSQNITINFNGQNASDTDNNEGGQNTSTIINKYAIDITYANLVIDLTDIPNTQTITVNGAPTSVTVTYVWDVNNHIYVAQYVDANSNTVVPDAPAAEANNNPITIADAFYLTNHSDLSVWYKADLTEDYTYFEMFIDNTTKGTQDVKDVAYEIGAARAGSYDENTGAIVPGDARDGDFHAIRATSADWLDTINAMTGRIEDGAKIGQLTITVAPTEAGLNP